MRAALLVVGIALAVVVTAGQSVSVSRTADIASARQQQPLTPDATAAAPPVRCFGVTCPVLPPMGSHGGLPQPLSSSQPQPQVLALAQEEEATKAGTAKTAPEPVLRAKPFIPPNSIHAAAETTEQQQQQQPSRAGTGGAFADQLQRLQPQLQSAGQRVQQFGHSVGERMQSFGKTIAGLGGGGGGGAKADTGDEREQKANANANANANPNAGGVDPAQLPLNAHAQQQFMPPLQQQQQQQVMAQQSPLRDAKMEAALQRGNLEPLTIVQPSASASAGANAVNTGNAGSRFGAGGSMPPNTLNSAAGAGTGTRFVQPFGLPRSGVASTIAASAASEGHGGFGGGGGVAIVAAVPTPVTNVLPAVAPVVPAIPLPPVAPPPPVAPVTLAAVPVAVPICPHGHCH